MNTVIIVGAGQAGAALAAGLRDIGFPGRILLFGEEAHAPYERPALSKKFMTGDVGVGDITVLDPELSKKLGIELLTETKVDRIERANRTVTAGGVTYTYDYLVLATGGRARPLPRAEETGKPVVSVRRMEDALGLGALLEQSRRIAVIGGGWLGLEIAASCRQKGLEVCVIETASRLCARVAPESLSEDLAALHADKGIRLRLNEECRFAPGQVMFKDGSAFEPDVVVAAIGMVANDAIAHEAGLETDDGILVDEDFQTSDPAVFAIGDCARVRHEGGRGTRFESWQNANLSAAHVAARIAGAPLPAAEPAWFWSDQYEHNIQITGDVSDGLSEIVRGSGLRKTTLFLEGAELRGAIAINNARDISICRRFLAAGQAVDPAKLAEADLPLKNCAA